MVPLNVLVCVCLRVNLVGHVHAAFVLDLLFCYIVLVCCWCCVGAMLYGLFLVCFVFVLVCVCVCVVFVCFVFALLYDVVWCVFVCFCWYLMCDVAMCVLCWCECVFLCA